MAEGMKLVIRVATQTAELYKNGMLVKTYAISTAANGTGSAPNSYKTPTGRFKVSEKFGTDAPLGAMFKDRVFTGDVWSNAPDNPLQNSTDDLILTRILWLAGCEPQNANTKNRYIYLHGTNHEDRLGTRASHGCIRFSNKDIIDLFGALPEGAEVEILP